MAKKKSGQEFDVVVIGAGPAGYVAAIRCAQLGLKTACVDERVGKNGKPAPGGCCLHVGCIPSKALLDASEAYHRLGNRLPEMGIRCTQVELDVAVMIARKDRHVAQLAQGIASLFRANKIESIHGHGRLLERTRIEVCSGNTKTVMTAAHVILASGSRPNEIDSAPVDGQLIVDSSGALDFESVPETLGVVGAGIIGLELGSVWARLGAKVTLLEAQDRFLPMVDRQIGREAFKQFEKQGLQMHFGARVLGTEIHEREVHVAYEDREGKHNLPVDKLIVAVGRAPYTEGLFAPESGLALDERGFVDVDESCRTNLPGVYAVGDVVRGPMLAHKGSEEGVAVAELIAGRQNVIDHERISCIIYTNPEVAWVGRTEESLKAAREPYRAGCFPFAANGRALVMDAATGMVKILAHAENDRILGAHIVGPHASELISEVVVAMEFSASAEDLARTIHAHPTLSEAVHEAALAVDGRALHIPPRARR